MITSISGPEASRLILDCVQSMPVERVPLAAAQDKVLAETIVAQQSVPPWRSASMDGYVVRSDDIATIPCRLRVSGDIPAGSLKPPALTEQTAFRIMTGAPVPEWADTVVRVEDTNGGTEDVEIRNARDASHNVRARGEDFHAGDVLLMAGERIGAAALGVLASAGCATVAVHRAPTVSIVASGDELVRVSEFSAVMNAERIVSSNSYSLPALVRDVGGLPRDGGITHDDPRELQEAIEGAMACDMLITSGGVSVGERDFTRTVMRTMGADIKFWRVRIRPGGPLVFATLDGLPWVGLPGNPVSAMVTFELFVRPAIRKMLGQKLVYQVPQIVTLDEHMNLAPGLTHYLRVIVRQTDDGLHARFTGSQSSAILTSMMRANALLIVPEGTRECKPGDRFRALLSNGSILRTDTFPA